MNSNFVTHQRERGVMPRGKTNNDYRHPADMFPSLDVDQETEKLSRDIYERLLKIFEKYGCEPTPEGWQQLALELTLAHEPAIKIVNSMQRMTNEPNFFPIAAMYRMRKAEPHKPIAEIAREVAKAWGKKAKTLQSRYSNDKDKVRFEERNLPEAVTRHVSHRIALWRASEQINRRAKAHVI
jgi:hypothetical protein